MPRNRSITLDIISSTLKQNTNLAIALFAGVEVITSYNSETGKLKIETKNPICIRHYKDGRIYIYEKKRNKKIKSR